MNKENNQRQKKKQENVKMEQEQSRTRKTESISLYSHSFWSCLPHNRHFVFHSPAEFIKDSACFRFNTSVYNRCRPEQSRGSSFRNKHKVGFSILVLVIFCAFKVTPFFGFFVSFFVIIFNIGE